MYIKATKQSSSWESNSSSATQDILPILQNPKVHYHAHISPPLVPALSLPGSKRCHNKSLTGALHNMSDIYREQLLTPWPTLNPKDHNLLAVHNCSFNTFAATHHIGRLSPLPPNLKICHVMVTGTHLSQTQNHNLNPQQSMVNRMLGFIK